MLNSQKDILKCRPPFLMVLANKDWLLVESFQSSANGLSAIIIEKLEKILCQRAILLEEVPFYVGADIWELNYGATVMTLGHETLNEHPAKQLWQDWLDDKSKLSLAVSKL